MKKSINNFIRRYRFEYYFGLIIDEDLFVKMFGYLPPNVPFNELSGDEIFEIWKAERGYNHQLR